MKIKWTKEKFIELSKEKHKNKYDYSLVEYKKCEIKVKIICPIHGIFEQSPKCHLKGHGCQKCAGNKKKTTDEFVKEAKNIHGNFYDYSLVDYKRNLFKIKIICPNHGIFEETAKEHLKGHGCSKCKGLFKYTTETFIEKVRLKHDNRYDYSLVEYINSQTKIKVICPEHGMFEIIPAKHLWGDSCPTCSSSLGFGETWMKNCIKQNKKSYLYIVRLFNENENFIKVGVSTCKNNRRFNGIKFESGYNFEILKINKMKPDESYNMEQKIINEFKHLQYIPKIYFGGKNECFYTEILDYLDKKLIYC